MRAPIFDWLANDSAVRSLLEHHDQVNAFEDEATDADGAPVPLPYLRWSVVGGAPDNPITDAPGIDNAREQFDAIAADQDGAVALYRAAIAVLEQHGRTVSFNGTERDAETRAWRVSWDMSFWTNR